MPYLIFVEIRPYSTGMQRRKLSDRQAAATIQAPNRPAAEIGAEAAARGGELDQPRDEDERSLAVTQPIPFEKLRDLCTLTELTPKE